jgi:hypothetical protein
VKIYEAWKHVGWGDHIEVLDWDKGEITGHLERKPRIGDRIRFKMQSGQVLETTVTKVQTFPDPPDQFIATVEHVGYVDVEPPSEAFLRLHKSLKAT